MTSSWSTSEQKLAFVSFGHRWLDRMNCSLTNSVTWSFELIFIWTARFLKTWLCSIVVFSSSKHLRFSVSKALCQISFAVLTMQTKQKPFARIEKFSFKYPMIKMNLREFSNKLQFSILLFSNLNVVQSQSPRPGQLMWIAKNDDKGK